MSETTEKTRIRRIVETEGVKYEIYIPKTETAATLFYLEESDFLSFVGEIKNALADAQEKQANV
ncbi:hypothetical protein QMN07_03840 [Leptospira santarosai]|uniref:hypothetical protein n=1 Tax=Leptospira santarosai TaxID=28183 RepID=UPI000517BFD6|nr:hypothetical protein [Leptospira santarosai]MDI7216650.1 hypothetical protein [Leptospira santarosai]UZN09263.1 hypothetical protein M5D10_18465 [Leptospira santarosai]